MNYYRTSTGDKISKTAIDAKVKVAKQSALDEQFDEYGYNFCIECLQSGGVYLDCSHTISVNEAQKSGRSELAYDPNNIRVRCRACHIQHDNKSKLL